MHVASSLWFSSSHSACLGWQSTSTASLRWTSGNLKPWSVRGRTRWKPNRRTWGQPEKRGTILRRLFLVMGPRWTHHFESKGSGSVQSLGSGRFWFGERFELCVGNSHVFRLWVGLISWERSWRKLFLQVLNQTLFTMQDLPDLHGTIANTNPLCNKQQNQHKGKNTKEHRQNYLEPTSLQMSSGFHSETDFGSVFSHYCCTLSNPFQLQRTSPKLPAFPILAPNEILAPMLPLGMIWLKRTKEFNKNDH